MFRIVLFGALAFGLASPAIGQTYDDPPVVSRTVAFRDLDLTSAPGARELDRRIQAAARFVCHVRTPSGLIPFAYSRRCVDQALREVAPQVTNVVELARRNQLRDSAIRVAAQ